MDPMPRTPWNLAAHLVLVALALLTATPAVAQLDGDDGVAVDRAPADDPRPPDEPRADEPVDPCAAPTPGTDVIVNGSRTYPFAPAHGRFFNWHRKARQPACWPGYLITTQAEFGGSAIAPVVWQKGYPTVDAIVVHETTADRGLNRTDTGVHFLIERDGTIIQLADLNSRYNHASNSVVNNRAIGIELSNEPYPNFAAGAVRHKDGAVVKVPWAPGGTIAVPPTVQLAALHDLITALLALREPTPAARPLPYSGISIPARWHNFAINHEFLFSMSGYRIFNASIDPSVWRGRNLIVEQPGISSHSIIYDHADGGAPLLYAWLAWRGRPSPERELVQILTGCTLHRLTARDPLVTMSPPVFGKDYEVKWIDDKRVVTDHEIPTYPMARLLTFARPCTTIDLAPPAQDLEIEATAADPPPPAAPPATEVSGTTGPSGDTASGGDSTGDSTDDRTSNGDAGPSGGDEPSNPPGADVE